MPKLLSQAQIDLFWEEGFLAPIRVMSARVAVTTASSPTALSRTQLTSWNR